MDRRDPPSPDSADALLLQLRARIADQRAGRMMGAGDPAPTPEPVGEYLERAAQVADIGTTVPLFPHLRPLRRAVAQFSARVILYFLRLVTVDQRQFNRVLLRAVGTLDREAQAVRSQVERQAQATASRDALTTIRSELHARLLAVEAAVPERDRWFADLAERDSGHARAIADLRAAVAYLRAQIADRDRRIDALLAEVGGTPVIARDTPAAPPPTAPTGTAGAFDSWAFAQAFHGDEESIKANQARYVRYFASGDVLDVGCGRGEFLELLRDAGIRARGVDLSNEMVLRCREKRLDVIKADALAYLEALPDATLGGIFAGQVIEHLATPAIQTFLHLAYRKLRPDGVLVIETLNPECLLVHYRWFWMDLTHVRLIHPETLKFLLVTIGFRDFEGVLIGSREAAPLIPPLTLPAGDAATLADFNAATDHLNRLLHSNPDYALIARR